jgi:hypothetical protein
MAYEHGVTPLMIQPGKPMIRSTRENIGAQGRSLSAIRADRSRTSCAPRSVYIHVQIRDTGASLHIGIEPPTRGFSERKANFCF